MNRAVASIADEVRDRLARAFLRRADAFDRLARRARQRLLASRVHDLRVLTRRLRASVWVARHVARPSAFRVLRRDLRTLGRALGERRLLDVALADAAAYGLDGAPLAARQAAAGVAVAKLLKPARRAAMVARLRAAARALAGPARPRLAGALQRRAGRLQAALEAAPRGKAELHALRIEAKKARYALEALGRDGEFLRGLQSAIGRAHDLEILQELLGASPRAARDEASARRRALRVMDGLVARALQRLTP